MFAFVFLCCFALCWYRCLTRADHLPKDVLPSVILTLRNLRCEAARVLTRTVEQLMMMNIVLNL
jgi:hypothetical protein